MTTATEEVVIPRGTPDDFNGSRVATVRIADIDIPDYQRVVKNPWVREIALGWRDELFRYPILNPQGGGRYECVDGQHTIQAAKLRGHRELPCVVRTVVMDEAEAAATFSDINTKRKHPTPYDLYNSDAKAGRDDAVMLRLIATDRGLTVSAGAAGANNLRCISQARMIIRTHGAEVLGAALDVLVNAYDPRAFTKAADYQTWLEAIESRIERVMVMGMVDLIVRAQAFGTFNVEQSAHRLQSFRFSYAGATTRLTPANFPLYLNTLMQSGKMNLPALNSGSGQGRIYGKAFAIAIYGPDKAKQLYP